MEFDLNLADFELLAKTALRDRNTDFSKGRVANRLRTVFSGMELGRASSSDSFELRRCLARNINDLYRSENGDGVRIPPSVASALNVHKFASGFKLASDGSLVATNHPLSERRLVCIMTAIRLNIDIYVKACDNLDDMISKLGHADTSKSSYAMQQFCNFAMRPLKSMMSLIRSAADGAVKPAVLKHFLPNIANAVNTVRKQFDHIKDQLVGNELNTLSDLINAAVSLAEDFGADVSRLRISEQVEIPLALEGLSPEVVDKIVEPVAPDVSSDDATVKRQRQVWNDIADSASGIVRKYRLDVSGLVEFTEEEIKIFAQPDSEAASVISRKVNAIVDALKRIEEADLDATAKKKFCEKAISQNGELDEKDFEVEVAKYREAMLKKASDNHRKDFEKNVSERVLSAIVDDKTCELGLDNLTKDFPTMRSFVKHVKKDHKDGELPLLDLKKDGVLLGLLSKKLKKAESVFDNYRTANNLDEFERSVKDAIDKTADELVKRLKNVLTTAMFEDDRTILTVLALDPSKAEEFEEKFKVAMVRFQNNVVARVVQVQLAGKLAASQSRQDYVDVVGGPVSSGFRSRFGFGPQRTRAKKMPTGFKDGFRVIFRDRPEVSKVRKPKDDFDVGLDRERGETGAKLLSDVRGFFADLFTPAARNTDGMKNLFLSRASVIQAMMIDPALIESVAVPGDAKNGDAVRVRITEFLSAIGESVNFGQLTPADFKGALASALNGDAFKEFSVDIRQAGTQVLEAMQLRLTAELTDVLRKMSSAGSGMNLGLKTLAELGASGLGSMKEGYGKFLASALDSYFTDQKLAADHDRMLESFFRNGKPGGSVGDALSALIKGAGPVFQKVLQSIPIDGLPPEIVKALFDVKSGLAPISDEEIERRLEAAIKANNDNPKNRRIEGVEVVGTLGAASVAQALHCRFFLEDGRVETKVVKLRRSGIVEIAERERAFFMGKAGEIGQAMAKTFGARMAGIMEEFDFTNEAKWIEQGQCYGNPGLYGAAAKIDKNSMFKVNSMKASKLLSADKDILVLDMAPGQPVDRKLRSVRERLDRITSKLAKKQTGVNGAEMIVYRANSSFDLMEIRRNLTSMYDELSTQRGLIEELVRRFSSELFFRNYDGKSSGGGFMHGDLHGGNMLINNNVLSVIDYGNSHSFTNAERQQIVRFVAACGFSQADMVLSSIGELLKTDLGKRADYRKLMADISVILSKGTGNDIASRGMAVVQYLQQHDVQVPGPIMNFTETVMRLDAVHRETEAVMDDIASVIEDLAIDPNVDPDLDPYAKIGDELFKGYMNNIIADNDYGREKIDRQCAKLDAIIQKCFDDKQQITKEDYEGCLLPLIKLLSECPVTIPLGGDPEPIGLIMRRVRRKLEAMGDKLFKPRDEREAGLSEDDTPYSLISSIKIAYSNVCMSASTLIAASSSWEPFAGSSINKCMSAGLSQHGNFTLGRIVGGGSSLSMLWNSDVVVSAAELELHRAQVSSDAQKQYLRRVGTIDSRSRRIIDRVISDHFLWSPGDPKTFFADKSWHAKSESLRYLSSVLKLNRDKLRAGLEAAGIAYDERIENYAMIAFCMKHGVADALAAMPETSFDSMIGLDAAAKKTLRFIREDKSVVDAVRTCRCLVVSAKEVKDSALKAIDFYARNNLRPISQEVHWNDPKSVGALVTAIGYRYNTLKTFMDKENYKGKVAKFSAQYAMMRFLLEQGVLDPMAVLDVKARDAVLNQFAKIKPNGKELKELMSTVLGYMK